MNPRTRSRTITSIGSSPNPVNSGPASPMRLSSVPAPKFADVVRRKLAVSRGSQVQRPSTAGVGRSSWSAESKRLALLGPVQWHLSDPYQACCRKRCRLTTLEDSAHNVRCQECQYVCGGLYNSITGHASPGDDLPVRIIWSRERSVSNFTAARAARLRTRCKAPRIVGQVQIAVDSGTPGFGQGSLGLIPDLPAS